MVTLTGNTLTLEEIDRVIFKNENVRALPEAMEKAALSRKAVERIVRENKTVYGITTGFGKFSSVPITPEDSDELQLNLIHSHSCGVGEPFSEAISLTMLLLRLNTLLKGCSGVSMPVIGLMLELVNHRVAPVVPEQGSLGASGDLIPLAHMALVLIGEGEVFYKGARRPTPEVFEEIGIKPVVLRAKDGLAVINGTPSHTAVAVVALLEAEKLAFQAELTASMSLEALYGIIDVFDDDIQQVRGYPEQIDVARRFRRILEGSLLTTRQGERRVQDAYTLRCIPQVFGACRQVLGYVREKLSIEINAATDNPLIFDDGEKVLSGGNFHGEPVAFAMDFLKLAICEFASMSERRTERLINPQLNDLPPFLSPRPGLETGVMILQYCAAALVSENKTLAHPASVDSIPTSANQEDHVSMGATAARHAYQIIQNTRNVIAIELLCAAQAAELRGSEKLAPATKAVFDTLRRFSAPIKKDRIFSEDIKKTADWMKNGDWSGLFLKKL